MLQHLDLERTQYHIHKLGHLASRGTQNGLSNSMRTWPQPPQQHALKKRTRNQTLLKVGKGSALSARHLTSALDAKKMPPMYLH